MAAKGSSKLKQKVSLERLKAAADHYNHGRYQVARGEVEVALRNDPSNWQAHTLMGAISTLLNDPETAVKHFSAALSLGNDPELPLLLGESLRRSRRYDDAIDRLRKYIDARPADSRGYFQLGLAQEGLEAYADAEQSYRAALSLAPGDADASNNLGHVLRMLGRLDEAEAVFRAAVPLAPKAMLLRDNLAALLASRPDRLEEAIQCYVENFEVEPSARRAFNIAALMGRAGRTTDALAYYEKTLELDPDHAGAYNDIGFLYFSSNMFSEAEFCFRKAAEIDGNRPEFLTNLGATLGATGRVEEAETFLKAAIALKPDNAKPYHFLATGYLARSLPLLAMEWEREGLKVEPNSLDSLIQLAVLEMDVGNMAEAVALYQRAHDAGGPDVVRILMALMVPPVMGTREEILAVRNQMESRLDALLADPTLRIDIGQLRLMVDSGFYLAFQGLNNCGLMSKISRLFRQACPELNWRADWVDQPAIPGRKIRVGFVSKFLFNHSVGTAFSSIILDLAAREDYEVTVISLGQSAEQTLDAVHLELINAVSLYLPLPDNDLVKVRDALAELRFDVLIFTDLGMYAYGNFLAHFRMARVQGSFNGHPDTSGISTVDCRFSWDEPGEVAGADAHYTEKLVRLKYGGGVVPGPKDADVEFPRMAVGLSDKRCYAVPAKLQKLHPDFDAAMAGILKADPDGEVVLFKDNINPSWSELLAQRFEKTIPDPSLRARIRFAEWLPGAMFSSMLLHADVVLDPFHFGLGTTALLAHSLGVPLVTWPGEMFRARVVAGNYEIFGVTDTVADSLDRYVEIAVDLASNPDKRKDIGHRIRQGMVAFRNEQLKYSGDELADALRRLARETAA